MRDREQDAIAIGESRAARVRAEYSGMPSGRNVLVHGARCHPRSLQDEHMLFADVAVRWIAAARFHEDEYRGVAGLRVVR
ncbi:MAG: hypothetical protein U1E76_28170 [Planctomycetota bacterium]